MKLYRHYKNKPYKVLGEAKHSETLEDVVIYECLYENPTSKLWVRPKAMFYGDHEGRPRFARVEPQIEIRTHVDTKEIAPLIEATMGEFKEQEFHRRLSGKKNPMLLLASIDGEVAGFKLGYEDEPGVFYSWLGAVTPRFQRYGLGRELMQRQHEWCLEQGYTKVRTKTMNRFMPMLILNLRSGFEIVNTLNEGPLFKIVLEKDLSQAPKV